MIYYLDTSALVKRYFAEPGSASVRRLFRGRQLATVRVAYAELAATIARLHREELVTHRARDRVFARMERDFSAIAVVEVRRALVQSVPELVIRQPLRGYDAVHLAAALLLREQGAAVDFWSADGQLVAAARAEGLKATHVGA